MSEPVTLTLSTGEGGSVVSWDGAMLVFCSSRAFAPGAPVKLAIALADGSLDVELKAIGSRRAEGETMFEVRARAMNLRRELRQRLDAALSPR
jgi:hypothetical protein